MAVASSCRDSSSGTGTTSGGPSGTATRASSSTPARSAADFVKLTTTRSHASGPSRCWMSAIARNVAKTSRVCGEGRDARASATSARAVASTLECCRTSIEARWNPNVSTCHRRCCSSPHASRGAPPASRERCSVSMSVRNSDGPGVGPADAQPGRGEPMRRQAQLPPVGRVGQRPTEFGGDLGKLGRVPIQRPAQRAARRHVALGHRQRPGDPPGGRLHAPERMVGLDRHRGPRDLGGDGGVAVTIAPHPGAPSEERRERGRPRSTAFGVEGAVHRAIDRRQGHEDRLIEQGERCAHLIERLGTVPADRLRAPQPGDLLAQPAMDLLLVGGSGGQVLELFEQGADPPQVLDHGATLGLGGVGGQHRA